MPELSLATEPVACALCGGTSDALLCWNDALQIVRCRACGIVYVNPQPTESALKQHYSAPNLIEQDGWSSYFQHQPEQIRALWQRRFADVRLWKDGPGTRLLDVGCGYGDFLCEAQRAGWRACGFEFSPAVAKVAREKYGLSVEVGEIFEIGAAENSFDVVTMWHVLEHMRNPLAVLRRVHGFLAPGGVLVIEVPNLNFLVRKSYRYPLSVTLHLYHFSPATLSALVGKAGFQVRACRPGHTGYLYPSQAKVYAKKCIYGVTRMADRLLGVNVGDAIRLYAAKASKDDGASA